MAAPKKIITNEKTCTICKRTFPRNNFYFRVSYGHADGFQPKCKECLGAKFTDPTSDPNFVAKEYLTCAGTCRQPKTLVEYYDSSNPSHEKGKIPICKVCLFTMSTVKKELDINKFKSVLEKIDRPFIYDIVKLYVVAKNDMVGGYLRHLTKSEFKLMTYSDSVFEAGIAPESVQSTNIVTSNKSGIEMSVMDLQNKNDVINILGRDPFENEPEENKKYLYNALIDFLDDSTLKDSFKLPIVIEIVKSLSQIEKMNRAISSITVADIVDNVNTMKNLMSAKKQAMDGILAMAKDNGISVNHSNNKSKGAGTLSGIIKDLMEKDIKEALINLYDIKTCDGMMQVAEISNKSIMNQLMLNESDYTDMIREQREMIIFHEDKALKLEEENRLLKIKIRELMEG